ncbi:MAG: discoidin domain-containing protein [Bacteroidaceae bacterium]|nr:discoidin domain-containing protein [Bacteroidaceae bacterium]
MMQRLLYILLLLCCNTYLPADVNVLPKWALGGFERPEGVNPLIQPVTNTLFLCPMTGTRVKWECADTFNPAAVEKDGKVCILYRAEDNPNVGIGKRTSRIGYTESADGIRIDYRQKTPVMFPDSSAMSMKYEWTGGCEDPRVVEASIDGKPLYVMTYTAYDRKTARLSVATSPDLQTWTHHGPCFQYAYDGKFNNQFCKSGSIVTEVKDGRLQACKVRINGELKYFMYWGEYAVYGATSEDLVNWTPLVNEDGSLKSLAKPRNGHFDSTMTECGPPAVVTEYGIILIYNGKNKSGSDGDTSLAAGTYAAGQMLFSKDNPLTLLDRLDKPFFRPMAAFEKTGQYSAGTVFVEGLVYHQDKYFLYYGCADSFVGVAVYDPKTSPHVGDPLPTADVPEGVVNQLESVNSGKMRCFVHSYSGCTKESEGPMNMNASYLYPNSKWCDTSTANPWVVMEFTSIYSIGRVVVRDVGQREANCGNVPEWWVYTRTNTTEGWQLVAHEENVEGKDIKDVSFPPVEARYVKLVFTRGTRPSGEADNAIRLYGCDIYGEFVRDISRTDGIIGAGKTVLMSYDVSAQLGSPLNLLTGTADKSRAWRPSQGIPVSDPLRYVLIDLEKSYNVKRFLLYDAKSMDESATNMDAYQIFLSDECPDLSLISPSGDGNECWTMAADKKNGGSVNKKLHNLSTPIRCRYVKLVFPRTNETMNKATAPALYAFHIYGTEAESEDGIMEELRVKNEEGSDGHPEGESQFFGATYDLSGRLINLQSSTLNSQRKKGIFIKGNRKVLK